MDAVEIAPGIYSILIADQSFEARIDNGGGALRVSVAGREYPAMAAIGVSRLWDEAALVEVQGYAVIPAG